MWTHATIMCNINHMSTYETTLRIINSCVDIFTQIAQYELYMGMFFYSECLLRIIHFNIQILLLLCVLQHRENQQQITVKQIKSKIEMKDENRTQCQYVIHGIKSFRNQIPLELSKQLI